MAKKNVHVVSTGSGWTVKKEGASRAIRRFDSQQAAVAYGRSVSKSDSTDLIVHNRNGLIRSKDSYGSDPVPLKSKKK